MLGASLNKIFPSFETFWPVNPHRVAYVVSQIQTIKITKTKTVTQSYFRPTKFKFHYVAPQFFFIRPSKLRQISLIEIHTYFSLGLNLRDIPNSIIPQTTLRLLPIPVGLLVLPCTRQCRRSPPYSLPLFSTCHGHKNRRRPVPVPVTGVRYNSLL